MNFEKFKKLPEKEQEELAFHAYREDEIFDGVRKEFLNKYGENPKIAQVLVDNYGLGGAALIILTLNKGTKRLILPEKFMGFEIYRRYTNSGHEVYDHPQDPQAIKKT